jgi:hypothetical protein
VSDEHDGQVVALRQQEQALGRLAHLPDASGRALQLVRRQGLDGIHDEHGRRQAARRLDDGLDVDRAEDVQPLDKRSLEQAQTPGAKLELARRLLPGDIEDRAIRLRGEGCRRAQRERRLPDAGLAREQDEAADDDPAAEDPVELGNAEREPWSRPGCDATEGHRLPGSGSGCAGAAPACPARGTGKDRLDEGVPRSAAPALPFPPWERGGARLADVAARGPRHA